MELRDGAIILEYHNMKDEGGIIIMWAGHEELEIILPYKTILLDSDLIPARSSYSTVPRQS